MDAVLGLLAVVVSGALIGGLLVWLASSLGFVYYALVEHRRPRSAARRPDDFSDY